MKSAGIMTGINKNVVTLSITSLLTDISSEMLYPIIPIFLTSVLGAPMALLGLIEGVAEAAASILKVVSGYASDLLEKRKPLVVGGYSVSALGKLILVWAYAWPLVFLARVMDRIGKGVRTSPRDAMIADSCGPEYRGKAFGFHRAMDTAGACLGPLIAILLLNIFKNDMRSVFLIAFIPAVAGVAILTLFLKEPIRRVLKGAHRSEGNVRKLTPRSLKFILISGLFFIGNSSDAFLILRAKGIGMTTTMVIFAYVLYNVSYSALSLPAGIVSDRFSKKSVIVAGYIIFSLVYFCFSRYINRATVWPIFLIYGFYMAMTDGVSKAFLSDISDKDARGYAIGLYYCVTGFAALLASMIAGAIWTYAGPAACFMYSSFIGSVAAVALVVII